METKATAAISPDPNTLPPTPPFYEKAPKPAEAQGSSSPDLRLVIEADQASGSFVYKTVDRRTGEVVSQLPREEVLKLRDELEYNAGAVIKTRV